MARAPCSAKVTGRSGDDAILKAGPPLLHEPARRPTRREQRLDDAA
jgi:hypothetical protein